MKRTRPPKIDRWRKEGRIWHETTKSAARQQHSHGIQTYSTHIHLSLSLSLSLAERAVIYRLATGSYSPSFTEKPSRVWYPKIAPTRRLASAFSTYTHDDKKEKKSFVVFQCRLRLYYIGRLLAMRLASWLVPCRVLQHTPTNDPIANRLPINK